MNIKWVLKKFDDLTLDELYAILQLRIEVFIVEQNCPFQDADNKDQLTHHLMGWQDDLLCAYTRILPPGIFYELPSIGRVVTSPKTRKNGLGRLLMERSIRETENLYGPLNIRIGAQFYLKKFYQSLGFIQSSEIYLEDNIEHIEMTRTADGSKFTT
ncbi:MAG: hypothetical protein JWM28_3146 [Chitinophagaceae bacterium]|nr:hypothetical protein [Chitinophagaceae bacterium]